MSKIIGDRNMNFIIANVWGAAATLTEKPGSQIFMAVLFLIYALILNYQYESKSKSKDTT